MSKQEVIRDTVFLFVRTLIIRVLQIPVFIVLSSLLGPANLGLLKLIEIVPMLAKYGIVSFPAVIAREVSRQIDAEGVLKETTARNTAYMATILFSTFAAIATFLAGFLLYGSQPGVFTGLAIACVTLIGNGVISLYLNTLTLRKDFKALAFFEVLRVVIYSVLVLVFAKYFGVAGALAAAALAAFLSLIWAKVKIPLNVHLQLSASEIKRQFPLATSLSLVTILTGAQIWVERGLAGTLWGLSSLGLLVFVMTLLEAFNLFAKNVLKAIGIRIYGKMDGARITDAIVRENVFKPTLVLLTGLSVFSGALIIAGPPAIAAWLPDYIGTIDMLPWVGLNLWLSLMPAIYLTAMVSESINMHWHVVAIRAGSLVVFALSTWTFFHAGWNIDTVLVSRAMSLLLTCALAVYFFHVSVTVSTRTFLRSLVHYAIPILWSYAVALLIQKYSPLFPLNVFGTAVVSLLLFFIACLPLVFLLESQTDILKQIKQSYKRRSAT